jgi:hypothetical protein
MIQSYLKLKYPHICSEAKQASTHHDKNIINNKVICGYLRILSLRSPKKSWGRWRRERQNVCAGINIPYLSSQDLLHARLEATLLPAPSLRGLRVHLLDDLCKRRPDLLIRL